MSAYYVIKVEDRNLPLLNNLIICHRPLEHMGEFYVASAESRPVSWYDTEEELLNKFPHANPKLSIQIVRDTE